MKNKITKEHKKLVIFGAGAGCRIILNILDETNIYKTVGIIEKKNYKNQIGDIILGDDSKIPRLIDNGIKYAAISIGDPKIRRKIRLKCEKFNIKLITVISKKAIVSKNAKIGKGTIILPGATIYDNPVIKDNCWVGIGALVTHDTIIGKDCMIGGGSKIGAYSELKNCVTVGWGANIGLNLKIKENSVIGFGSNVVKDVEKNKVVKGNPAK